MPVRWSQFTGGLYSEVKYIGILDGGYETVSYAQVVARTGSTVFRNLFSIKKPEVTGFLNAKEISKYTLICLVFAPDNKLIETRIYFLFYLFIFFFS